MRAIDGDELLKWFQEWENEAKRQGAALSEAYALMAIGIVEMMPTIEPERKTGVWLDDDENGKVMTSGYCPYCSVCKEMAECITKYCPHCGAEMEGVE